MIVYLFNDDIYITIDLPEKINGMFPVYQDDKLIANISANGDIWMFELSDEFYSNTNRSLKCELLPYEVNTLSPINVPRSFNIVALPKYDPNTAIFDSFREITIGNDPSCDIYYPYNVNSTKEIIKASIQTAAKWIVETNYTNFFVSGKRVKTGDKILAGDYLFFYGLKVIFLGSKLIINNPKNAVKIANNGKIRSANIESKKLDAFQVSPEAKAQKKDEPLYSKEDYFYKAPRLNYIVKETEVEIQEPTPPLEENDQSVLLTIGPQLTMVTTSVVSLLNYIDNYLSGTATKKRFIVSMVTIGVTILSALLWPNLARLIRKHKNKKQEKNRVNVYTKYLENKSAEIESIKKEQKEITETNNPSIEKCVSIIDNKSKELWQRNIDHEDFLTVRVGIGNIKTKIKTKKPSESFDNNDELIKKMNLIIEKSSTIDNVPITYKFTNKSINAIVGKKELVNNFLQCVFLEIMTLHAYTDLKIVCFSKEVNDYDYLKIAPHCWNNNKSTRYITSTMDEFNTITPELEKIFDARVSDSEEVQLEDNGEESSGKKDYHDYRPYYLFFIDDISMVRNNSLITKILHYKRNMGFSILITSDSIASLPSETTDFICIEQDDSVMMTSNVNVNEQKFKADFNTSVDMNSCIQKLANIPIQKEKEKYELPKSLTFLEMYNLGRVEQFNSLSRWSDNNPVNTLSVPVGIDQSGELFKMDIHEKAFGPHGLVAGTTGSGKSEWIITYILSLAVNFSPDEVQFVLIDYKGGGLAMSFENQELGVKLPHLAGTITNLDKSEIFRSISAIESELKRRQSVFNDAREKLKEGSMNIYKYQQYYRKGLVDEPMSHLLIICDEFAELKAQQPEFMDQLISTSRIGRSLGIHLILATQKPSGVVNEQIWSNSKFKVCLKVQDRGDSQEMIKKPDAAYLKQTGAFYLQVGNDDYFNLGQSAWAGAKYYPSDVIKKDIDESIQYIDNLGRTISTYEGVVEDKGEAKGEELLNIVSYISNVSKEISVNSRQLWLENISPNTTIKQLYEKYGKPKVTQFSYDIAIGEYDEPRRQEQSMLKIDLGAGNVAIIGQNTEGNDKLISTIIWSSVCDHTPYEIAYYIIDFSAETMKKFAKLPHVGEVLFQDNQDNVIDLIDMIEEELERRKELLSDYNGSYFYYNKVSKKKLPLIALVIDGFEVFSEIMPKVSEYLNTLFRDAPKYGIIFIISSNAPNVLRTRQLQYFNHTIVMQMNDDAQYRMITDCRKGLIPKKTLARGICKLNSEDKDSYCEFQTSFIDSEEKELETIKAYSNKCIDYYKYKVKQLAKIPDDVTSNDLTKYITNINEVPIGIDFYEKSIAKYNFNSQKVQIITGKNIKQDINFIYGLTTLIAKIPNVKVRVLDMLNIFKKPMLDFKVFNEKLEVVTSALQQDAESKTDQQPIAVNFIIGAGQYKQILSEAGKKIFNELFTNLPKTKNTIFVLVDDYDKIRTLKIEKWFQTVNMNNAIWLDQGFATQSFITSNEVNEQDKKYAFAGMSFVVQGGEYKLIKTVMDGDD